MDTVIKLEQINGAHEWKMKRSDALCLADVILVDNKIIIIKKFDSIGRVCVCVSSSIEGKRCVNCYLQTSPYWSKSNSCLYFMGHMSESDFSNCHASNEWCKHSVCMSICANRLRVFQFDLYARKKFKSMKNHTPACDVFRRSWFWLIEREYAWQHLFAIPKLAAAHTHSRDNQQRKGKKKQINIVSGARIAQIDRLMFVEFYFRVRAAIKQFCFRFLLLLNSSIDSNRKNTLCARATRSVSGCWACGRCW